MATINEDGSCQKCGSFDVKYVDCWNCGGEGMLEDVDSWQGVPDYPCSICNGEGGYHVCQECAKAWEATG